MAIYLGGNNTRPYVGGTKINEAYLGSVKLLNGGIPVLAPSSMRFQFDEAGYDPTTATSGGVTLASKGWTCVRRSSTIWDFTHTANFSADALAAFYSGGTNIPTQPYRVLEVNVGSSWNYYRALFHNQAYLDNVPVFNIVSSGTADNFYLMFGSCPNFNNTVSWLKKVASAFQGYSVSAINSSTKSASSVPTSLGGSKGRTRILSKTGSGSESFSVTLHPGDWVYIAVRGYTAGASPRTSNARISARTAGTDIVRSYNNSSSYILNASASGDYGSKVTQESTMRWGYPQGTTMTCGNCYRQARSTNNPYANVYVDSFKFL